MGPLHNGIGMSWSLGGILCLVHPGISLDISMDTTPWWFTALLWSACTPQWYLQRMCSQSQHVERWELPHHTPAPRSSPWDHPNLPLCRACLWNLISQHTNAWSLLKNCNPRSLMKKSLITSQENNFSLNFIRYYLSFNPQQWIVYKSYVHSQQN